MKVARSAYTPSAQCPSSGCTTSERLARSAGVETRRGKRQKPRILRPWGRWRARSSSALAGLRRPHVRRSEVDRGTGAPPGAEFELLRLRGLVSGTPELREPSGSRIRHREV